MATLVRIDDIYINLDNVTVIGVDAPNEAVVVSFCNTQEGMIDTITLTGEQGARLLRWLDAGGRVSEVSPPSRDDSLEARCTIVAHEEDGEPIFASERAGDNF